MSEEQNIPIPENETERLKALYSYNILDTEADENIDNLVKLVAQVCERPICFVSLLDENRQWFKSKIGFEPKEMPRSVSFCQHTIMQIDTLEIKDITEDDRFKNHPLVINPPNFRYYAGQPLVDEKGFILGTLCVMDNKVGQLNELQKNALQVAANAVSQEIQNRKKRIDLDEYKKFFEMSLDFFCVAGMDGYFKKINSIFSNKLGWTEEEIIKQPITYFVHEDDRQNTADEITKLNDRRYNSVGFINRFRKKDGDYLYLKWNCKPDTVSDNLFAVATDISDLVKIEKERIAGEQNLKENERNFREIFKGSEVAIMVEAADDSTILDLNQACAELHGYSIEEMIGMDIFKTIPPDHIEKSKANYLKFKKEGGEFLDAFVYTSEQESIPVQISITKIVYNGQIANLLFFYNASERKEKERKLEEAKFLAEKSAEFKSQFLANMSHEIRTPLNALIGFADLLEETEPNEVQKEYINIIQNAGADLLVVINDILDLTKIEAGKMKIRPQNFDLHVLLNNVLKLHRFKAQEKDIDLLLEIDEGVPETVFADNTRISQILNNLVNNAIKFTKRGYVKIAVSATSNYPESHMFTFNIKDTGIGIPKIELKTIFENFTQVDSSLQRKYSGTGLGLSIVNQLVQLMNGSIEVRSEKNKGSEFTFSIPMGVVKGPIKANGEDILENADFSNVKLLVCEDNEVNIALIKKVLNKLGVHAHIATNGLEATEMAKNTEFDLIFMDLQMHVMDGYEATKRIKEFSKVPIYAMSAHVLEEERARCINAGMIGFLSKPFNLVEIVNALQTVSNTNKFEKLQTLADGDVKFMKTLLELFQETGKKELKVFLSANNKNDADKMARVVHKLRPSFISFDCESILPLVDKIENQKANNQDIQKFIAEFNTVLNLVEKKINEFV